GCSPDKLKRILRAAGVALDEMQFVPKGKALNTEPMTVNLADTPPKKRAARSAKPAKNGGDARPSWINVDAQRANGEHDFTKLTEVLTDAGSEGVDKGALYHRHGIYLATTNAALANGLMREEAGRCYLNSAAE